MDERGAEQGAQTSGDDPMSPVRPFDVEGVGAPTDGMGLGMSGGGYRAMLFHLGALWRLNELGYLPKLTRISSVSGGSITSARLGLAWSKLDFDPQTRVARAFEEQVAAPVRELAGHTIDVSAVVVGAVLPFVSIADRVEKAYRKHLFGDATVAELPDPDGGHPRFVINACSVQTGELFRFEQGYVADWRVGVNRKAPAQIPLARAVAASSAFAPFLSPVIVDLDPEDFELVDGADLRREPYTKRVVLTDGGNYDNLGLETIYKRCRTVLVSDAVGMLPADEDPHEDWVRHGIRAVEMLLNQIVSLRKRQLLAAFTRAGDPRPGTYWSVRSEVAKYQLADALPFDAAFARRLGELPTRLAALSDELMNGLVNWGFVICDTAIRKYVDTHAPRPTRLPY